MVLSDIFPGMLSDILSGILSRILSDIVSGILSDIYSDVLSGILLHKLFLTLFLHSIWHLLRHSVGILSGIRARAPQHPELPIPIWCLALTLQCRKKTGVMAASEGRKQEGRTDGRKEGVGPV